jgi:osmotically inducible protein OsmC
MASELRRAEATWEGGLASGKGVVSAVSSGAFTDLPVSWASRTERSDGRTSPEELVATAHASCYCMALSHGLGEAGTPPDKLKVSATVTFQQIEGGWKVASSALTVTGTVPGMNAANFQEAAEAAKDGCPISGALKGNVDLSVKATLAG